MYNTFRKSTNVNGLSCVEKKPLRGFFSILAISDVPFEFVPASRERVLPTEWQVRAVLGDCTSKVISDFNSSATVSASCADQ